MKRYDAAKLNYDYKYARTQYHCEMELNRLNSAPLPVPSKFADIDPVFDYYSPVIIGNTEWMEANPEKTAAFLSAVKKGYEFAIENPEDAAEILLDAAPELDSELVHASQLYMKDQYIADAKQWGYIDPVRWNAFYNWINENGLSVEPIPENTGFSNEYLE